MAADATQLDGCRQYVGRTQITTGVENTPFANLSPLAHCAPRLLTKSVTETPRMGDRVSAHDEVNVVALTENAEEQSNLPIVRVSSLVSPEQMYARRDSTPMSGLLASRVALVQIEAPKATCSSPPHGSETVSGARRRSTTNSVSPKEVTIATVGVEQNYDAVPNAKETATDGSKGRARAESGSIPVQESETVPPPRYVAGILIPVAMSAVPWHEIEATVTDPKQLRVVPDVDVSAWLTRTSVHNFRRIVKGRAGTAEPRQEPR
jgi:hypothetical protein